MRPQRIALIDLDSTIADYEKAMTRDLKKLMGPDEQFVFPSFGVVVPDYVMERVKMIRQIPGWWRNLEPIESGFKIVNILRDFGYDINVLTACPSSAFNSATEKYEWCAKYLPYATVSTSKNKFLMYGRLLFDDRSAYVTEWLARRPNGLAIVPAKEWNKDLVHPQVIKWDGSNIYEVVLRIKENSEGTETIT